jgi:predicted nucleic acid-binding protein
VAQLSLVEVAHVIAHSHGEEAARDDMRLVLEMPIEIRGATDEQCIRAGLLRGRHRLSTVDAVIAVQTLDAGAALIHKDPEFEGVGGIREVRLPYKPRRVKLPRNRAGSA